MEVESRKRPRVDEDDPIQAKKRVLASVNGSPLVNGVVDAEEPSDASNLELFRKEAIYRRMKYYSRENERSQAHIAELERRKNTCEAGLAALSACWTQLVETIRLLARPEDLPPVDIKTREIFDLTTHIATPAAGLASALADNMDATQNLVTKFVQLGGQKQSALLHDEIYLKCQTVQTECTALRSQMDIMRVQLRDSVAEKEALHDALVAAETRADRLQSGTVLAMQARTVVEKFPQEEETEVPQRKLPSSPAQSQANDSAQDLQDVEEWQEVAKARIEKIIQLEHENAVLRDEKNILNAGIKYALPKALAENPHYQALLEHVSRLEHNVGSDQEDVKQLREEVEQLHRTRKEFEEDIIATTGQANQELRTLLAKRDSENLRLRDQRDQQGSELVERKQKDSLKMTSLQELKALVETRSERILVLESEIKRYKARLAAHAGNEDLMSFILRDQTEDVLYVEDLRTRVGAAEARVAVLERTLSNLEEGHPDATKYMKAEAQTRRQLEEVAQQLEKYQSIYGNASTLPPDVQKLSVQLRQKEEEIRKLRLLDTQRAQAETSLYAEIDKLSAAWETLDRQVNSKVFDLLAMEERVNKSGIDKAKLENKFYAAMRDKEAIENERKNLSRNLEKQAKVVERLVDSEKNLVAQVGDLEKEIVQWKKNTEQQELRADTFEKECAEWKHRTAFEKNRSEQFHAIVQEKDRVIERKRAELRKLEDSLSRSNKEVERQAAKLQMASTGPSSQKEAELLSEVEGLMRLLKCSTCKMRMRDTIITKCMHTFCKECVDTRITLRNRKCPFCNLTFSQSDVQPVFHQ